MERTKIKKKRPGIAHFFNTSLKCLMEDGNPVQSDQIELVLKGKKAKKIIQKLPKYLVTNF